ncbi:hypothetical protein QYM36_006725 [Artemia franciscana]|uniref:Uncharacterized protein n=1 Tax=Artemia franciscana TaxID=6661 RepID=A0AA88LAA8_ARTSF|nr:hypothetical protein QYM36_006725 [Artemia franciscana]
MEIVLSDVSSEGDNMSISDDGEEGEIIEYSAARCTNNSRTLASQIPNKPVENEEPEIVVLEVKKPAFVNENKENKRKKRTKQKEKLERKRPRLKKHGSSVDKFDQMAKRFKSRFKDTISTTPLLLPERPRKIRLSSIPMPQEQPKKKSTPNEEEMEEEDIRLRLALLLSMADKNDPELATRFSEIKKLLDDREDGDFLGSSLSVPTEPLCDIVEGSEGGIQSVMNKNILAEQRKHKAKLFLMAKDQVDKSFSQGWDSFGSFYENTFNAISNLNAMQPDFDKYKILFHYATSVLDNVVDVPPYILQIKEKSRSFFCSSQSSDGDDEELLRQAVMKSIVERKDAEEKKSEEVITTEEQICVVHEQQEEEEDAELLRAMLLVELSKKASREAEGSEKSNRKISQATKINVPKLKPIVIKFSDSDDECDWGEESEAEKARKRKEDRNAALNEIIEKAKTLKDKDSKSTLLTESSIKVRS